MQRYRAVHMVLLSLGFYLAVALAATAPALADQTAWLSPTTSSDGDELIGVAGQFKDRNNANTSNNTYSSCTLGNFPTDQACHSIWGGFAVSDIPDSAEVTQIAIRVEGDSTHENTFNKWEFRPYRDGNALTTYYQVAADTTEQVFENTFGNGQTITFPVVVTGDTVNGTTSSLQVGVRYRKLPGNVGSSQRGDLDHIQVQVTYTVPCEDADEDGYGAEENAECPEVGIDCDDTDPDVNPGAEEVCNGIDDDCSGVADDPFPTLGDECSEGVGACLDTGTIVCTLDETDVECDATPGAPQDEIPNDGIDQDCNGSDLVRGGGALEICRYAPAYCPPVIAPDIVQMGGQ